MINKRFRILTLVLILFLLTACRSEKGADALDGTAWQLVAMGDELPLAESTLTITFMEGQAGGNAGCNSYGGDYALNESEFAMTNIASTLLACLDSGVMEQEQAYLVFLGEVNRYSINEGMLYLTRPDGSTLRFIAQP